MSTKPTELPRWASSGGAITVPPSGKQDIGWVSQENVPPQYANWLHHRAYLWCQYLNDGALQGAHTFDNTVTIAGLLTATGGVTATGLITANGGLTASGTIDESAATTIKGPPRSYMIDVAAGLAVSAGPTYSTSYWAFTAGGQLVHVPFHVPANEQITSIVFWYNLGTTTPAAFTLYRRTPTSVLISIVSKNAAAVAGSGNVDLSVSPGSGALPYTTLATESYVLEMNSGGSGDQLRCIKVVTKRIA